MKVTLDTNAGTKLTWGPVVKETALFGESAFGECVLGEGADLEGILRILTSGSFPKPGDRDDLSDGERRQLRDALIFEAHIRDGRDVFVTLDGAFFGKEDGNKLILEKSHSTRIMRPGEFIQMCEDLRSR